MGKIVKSEENEEGTYEMQAPDGGWGYMIVVATIIVFSCTIIPMAAFGLIFGNFLQSIGDETTGTTLSNGMFNTVNSFMGLVANGVLNKYSYRKVGLAGSVIYFAGASGVVFSQNLVQLITFFGVIQGIGFGLLMPAVLSAFNSYFNRSMALMMSIAQASMVASTMAIPSLATWYMEHLGFRGTLGALAGLSLLCLPATASLQPVKWHLKKVLVPSLNVNTTVIPIDVKLDSKDSFDPNKTQIKPLLHTDKQMTASQKSLHQRIVHTKPRQSIISLGDRIASVTNINDLRDEENCESDPNTSFWKSLLDSMDMSLLKDPKYLNIGIGLALCFTADIAFISIIPLMLRNIGFEPQQIATMLAVYFGSDLVSRILLTVISGIVKFRSRNLVLFAALFSALCRVVLVSNDTYMWKMCSLAALGFLRCFIQTPLPLVISEEYSDKFSTAFSLYMAINGVVSLVFGPLMSMVKAYTHSDVMVCHLLTMAYSICVISWVVETFLNWKRQRTEEKE